jgi:hypothetical protein
MLHFDAIFGAVHDLSYEEKVKLRLLLDEELKSSGHSSGNGERKTSKLIGLFADEPDLIDRVLESVYEHRSRPLRVNQ